MATDKAPRTIRIKWVRSGIGFSYRQKELIRSLGLRRLNQVAERPDTPQIRGLVAKIPHLVEIVSEPSEPAQLSVPEYTLRPPEAAPVLPLQPAEQVATEEARAPVAVGEVPRPAAQPSSGKEKAAGKIPAPSKAVKAKKAAKPAAAEKGRPAKGAESKKGKTAAGKDARSSKKGKK